MMPVLLNQRGKARSISRRPAGRMSVGLLSPYPPTQCGLANFTAGLREGLLASRHGVDVGVVRLVEEPTWTTGPGVVYELSTGRGGDPASAAERLNRYDVVVVQHDYGVYGGTEGDQLLEVLARLRVPVIVVLHTVPGAPTDRQRQVLERVAGAAEAVVTMTQAGYHRLLTDYQIGRNKVVVIPRGAWPGGRPQRVREGARRPVVLTWGLLEPGKGVEWGIEAMPGLRVLDPPPLYMVAGRTHPRELARDGERYRDSLRRRAEQLGVADLVWFERGYLDQDSLRRLVTRADVVLLPYDSHERVCSGVLIEAVASLTPVVSTAFPHARELLADGLGTLVPPGDPQAIAAAVHRVLTDHAHAAAMVMRAAKLAPSLEWPVAAQRYWRVVDELTGRRAAVA